MATTGTVPEDEPARLPPSAGRIAPALQRLADDIRSLCPADAIVSLRFDGRLHADVDVRSLDQAALLEHVLPSALGAMVADVRRGKSTHAFFHRVTLVLDA